MASRQLIHGHDYATVIASVQAAVVLTLIHRHNVDSDASSTETNHCRADAAASAPMVADKVDA
jgi:hypothetical protein